MAKALQRDTGRRIVAYDARNHGSSPHAERMSYEDMADDLVDLVREDLGLERVALVGHSMGGRTMMLAAIRQGRMQLLYRPSVQSSYGKKIMKTKFEC